MIDEHPAHRPGGDCVKMSAVVPDGAQTGDSEVGFVNQRRRIEGMSLALPCQDLGA
jgi:hypothetical protein